jgi:hypothetical protein
MENKENRVCSEARRSDEAPRSALRSSASRLERHGYSSRRCLNLVRFRVARLEGVGRHGSRGSRSHGYSLSSTAAFFASGSFGGMRNTGKMQMATPVIRRPRQRGGRSHSTAAAAFPSAG